MKSKKPLTLKSYKPKVGITIGDPSGIGPLLALKALLAFGNSVDFTIIGDRWVLTQAAKFLAKTIEPENIDLKNVNQRNFKFGKIKAEYGRASVEYLDAAIGLINSKEIDCLVTCPISKQALGLAGFPYSGHTEYLSHKTKNNNLVMMLLNHQLKFSLVTRHVALKEVSRQLSQDKIYKTISLTYQSLKELFRIRQPRLMVCGLNPHASDNGLIGDEENSVIKPALKKFRLKVGPIEGPRPADIAIIEAKEDKFDCLIAMYHDQALIPLKLTGRQYGVNLTLGLPFIRTSPLHGTAFDIAATNLADPSSLIEAIRLAIRCRSNLKKD
ncbi:4-hydroxythreonine-4-phosphate dehydrogenase PdxA [bacterium]|nr:MAG: 4-hydroxythreonine-4-phosphate dehydrogenase PdxA [bacterium]